jgi:hypothetical protein
MFNFVGSLEPSSRVAFEDASHASIALPLEARLGLEGRDQPLIWAVVK